GNLPLASQHQSQLSDNAELSSNERLNDETTNIRPDISFQNSKQPTVGANFRSELEASDGTHTQTETNTTSSSDAAVNTGMHPFLFLQTYLLSIQILPFALNPKAKI
ncbi:unnamed protein product, partial [Rotaria magnacalcarata]